MKTGNNWQQFVSAGLMITAMLITTIAVATLNTEKEIKTERWQIENAPANSFKVVKATLQAVPSEYTGQCPAAIKFKAKISTEGGKGVVLFEIKRSDNVPAPSITIDFDRPGKKDTTFTWQSQESFSGWFQLKVALPNELLSNKSEISVLCQ